MNFYNNYVIVQAELLAKTEPQLFFTNWTLGSASILCRRRLAVANRSRRCTFQSSVNLQPWLVKTRFGFSNFTSKQFGFVG